VQAEQKIGTLRKLRSKRIQCISVDGKQIALIFHRNTFYALDNACPHKFASLCAGDLQGDRIICPWHGAGFNIATGESFSPLAPKGLNSYPVTVRNQSVFISLRDVENR
jgi:3-phenylpropionate/trans-cinnamate dioxygenase ferredoxin subunit